MARTHRSELRQQPRDCRHACGRVFLGSYHLVLGFADQLLACPGRRSDRRGGLMQAGIGCSALACHRHNDRLHRAFAADRDANGAVDRGGGVLAVPPGHAAARRSHLPPRSTLVGGTVQSRPRRQRRPENNGHHFRAAHRGQSGRLGLRHSQARADRSGFSLPCCHWLWAPCSAAGASSRRWDNASSTCGRWTASAPKPGAAATLALTVFGGVPVSTTHTITGAILGVGSMKRLSAVRWGVAGRVIWAWILTIPGTALVSMICWWVLSLW